MQKVRLGAHDLTKIGTNGDRTLEYDVVEKIKHPKYVNVLPPSNDIALLRLSEKVKLTPYIRPACLPTEQAISNAQGTACGWGTVEYKGSKSKVLLKASLDFFSQSECNTTFVPYEGRNLTLNVNHQHVCAGSRKSRRDTCQVNKIIARIREYFEFESN